MPTRRQERVSERIHQELGDLLQRRIRDPRLMNVTVTGVTVSPDLKQATVFISSLGNREVGNAALQALEHAASFIRRELAQRLAMRLTPGLRFVLDDSWQHGARIDELLEQLPATASADETTETDRGDDRQEE